MITTTKKSPIGFNITDIRYHLFQIKKGVKISPGSHTNHRHARTRDHEGIPKDT